ncbi:MAG TPA: ATP-binding protein [Acidimicrobiales bacterium]|nr:ATP-binding protein [Acidimicrobiales bacterium]
MRRARRRRPAEEMGEGDLSALTRQLGEAQQDVERLVLAFEAMPMGVVIGDADGTVWFRNGRAEALVGARHGDAVAARALDDMLLAGNDGPHSRTVELLGPPPRYLVVSAHSLRAASGEVVGRLAMLEDVTERRRVESVRRDFVANVSHELRTPVGAVAVLADTLADEDDPNVVRRLAARIQSEAARLGRLVADLLDLSRIEATVADAFATVDVVAAVEAAVGRVAPAADRRGIALEVTGVEAVAVHGDAEQLTSAVANLLDNGVKYSDPGTTVRLAIKVEGTWVAVVVEDQGIGIPARELDRIFERFYRVDRARSRETGGTGLGLSIVRNVAAAHGGHVRVTSEEGVGSSFALVLPLAD